MRFAVLADPDSWYLKDLTRAAADRHEIVPVAFRDLSTSLGGDDSIGFRCGKIDLVDMDAVLVRTMPPGSLEQVVFRMDLLARLEHAGVAVINSAKSIEAAVDKYLTSAKLQAAGLRTPRTVVCQTVDAALAGFDQLGGDVVVKPLFGAEGRGIVRINDQALAQRTFSLLVGLGAVLYVQQYIPHPGYDYRVLLVGDQAFGMKRVNPLDWRTNVSRGATAATMELTADLVAQARAAADAVGAKVAGIDFLPDKAGNLYVLEVNAVPGWQAISRVTGHDIAAAVLELAAHR